ncbi:MAG TPA: formylglycine-generating enzyme family protein [Pyrinomonadaceae bacterium]|jgi:formylglycine-generating enzyme required for sulfatase activity
MKIIALELSENATLDLIEVPAGSFLMGSADSETEKRINETPQHEVRIKSFHLGKFPVTQKQWLALMDSLPETDENFRDESFPVVNVWLEKAIEFCARLSKITGEKFRLPSEAEWEYACRAGTTTPFSFGKTITTDLANFNGEQPFRETPRGEFRKRLTPVGSFPPNNFGLYDMHGNVWEWCADVWHEDYTDAPTDGSAWLSGGDQSYCVQRGGSWLDRAANCRSAFRVGDIAHNDENIVGLRVCYSAN